MRWATRHYDDILLALWQHLVLVGAAMLMAFAISLFLGITTARRPRLYALVMAVTGMIFSIPGLALFALLIPWLGIGMLPAIVGLTAYALMILTRNIATGFHAIPLDVREARAEWDMAPGAICAKWNCRWRYRSSSPDYALPPPRLSASLRSRHISTPVDLAQLFSPGWISAIQRKYLSAAA